MEDLYSMLMQDVRFEEGLNACMNCGVCTGICPAAEYYNYDPRRVVDQVQTRNNDVIMELLKSETIWYCGQCMSCKTRCPRGNTPGHGDHGPAQSSPRSLVISQSRKKEDSSLQLKEPWVITF